MLELVDRHDSGSCVRKGVEVQVLSRALCYVSAKFKVAMKRSYSLLALVVCLLVVASVVSGCKRRPQNYAGLPDPQKGEVIDPHKAN